MKSTKGKPTNGVSVVQFSLMRQAVVYVARECQERQAALADVLSFASSEGYQELKVFDEYEALYTVLCREEISIIFMELSSAFTGIDEHDFTLFVHLCAIKNTCIVTPQFIYDMGDLAHMSKLRRDIFGTEKLISPVEQG
jgi:hypothetical protein